MDIETQLDMNRARAPKAIAETVFETMPPLSSPLMFGLASPTVFIICGSCSDRSYSSYSSSPVFYFWSWSWSPSCMCGWWVGTDLLLSSYSSYPWLSGSSSWSSSCSECLSSDSEPFWPCLRSYSCFSFCFLFYSSVVLPSSVVGSCSLSLALPVMQSSSSMNQESQTQRL